MDEATFAIMAISIMIIITMVTFMCTIIIMFNLTIMVLVACGA